MELFILKLQNVEINKIEEGDGSSIAGFDHGRDDLSGFRKAQIRLMKGPPVTLTHISRYRLEKVNTRNQHLQCNQMYILRD